jgi:type II secretory ATPase GspE/PulE/Tfp pilus assembly ATPase PilB-like protein
LDFAGALRFVLRQDPDVILVGETRDTETAQLVVQAALAGHLVLTTVHAGSALEAFDRFTQLGADRALLAQVTRLAVSQRLLRRVCPYCSGEGCFACEGSGLKGRLGVYETVAMSSPLASLIRRGAEPGELLRAARDQGYRPLLDSARELARRGVTTEAEMLRVLDGGIS